MWLTEVLGGWQKGKMMEGGQKVHISSYKVNPGDVPYSMVITVNTIWHNHFAIYTITVSNHSIFQIITLYT